MDTNAIAVANETGSRASKLDSGSLIDLSNEGHDLGFRWPIAVTSDVNDQVILESQDQDATRTLILFVAATTVRELTSHSDRIVFEVEVDGTRHSLKLIGHPDDFGLPCLTLSFEDSDN